MKVLITNDDGFEAPGISVLEEAVRSVFQDVVVAAPLHQQSGISHAVTLNRPMRCEDRGPGRWAIDGYPADCVFLAIHRLMDEPPDLVVSGINPGPNMGYDTVYSGTVAAAREGLMNGIPSIAFSLAATRSFDLASCLEPCRRVLTAWRELPPREPFLLNVNIPSRAEFGPMKGHRLCTLGTRVFANHTDEWTDPRGNRYLWLGGSDLAMKGCLESDTHWLGQGYMTLTALDWHTRSGQGLDHARRLDQTLTRLPKEAEDA